MWVVPDHTHTISKKETNPFLWLFKNARYAEGGGG